MTQDFTQGAALLSLQLSLVQAFPKKISASPKTELQLRQKGKLGFNSRCPASVIMSRCAGVCDRRKYERKAEHLQLLVRKRKLQLEQDLTARTEQRRNMLLI